MFLNLEVEVEILMKKTIKIIVAHERKLLREALGRVLAAQPDFWVIAKAKNFFEANKLSTKRKADVLLISSKLMPNITAAVKTNELLVISIKEKDSSPAEELNKLTCLRASHRQEHLSLNGTLKNLYELIRQVADAGPLNVGIEVKSEVNQFTSLTPREREIFSLLAQGLSNQQISRQLFITERTVKYHVSNVLRKVNVASRTEAAIKYMRAVS